MTTQEAFETSTAHLASAARTLSLIDPERVPAVQRDVLRAAIDMVDGVHRLLESAIPMSLFIETPQPRQAEATEHLGPPVPRSFLNWLEFEKGYECTGPLVSMPEASRQLGLPRTGLRSALNERSLPLYDLGQATLRTRIARGPSRDETVQVSAQQLAEYLSVERKWVYNHLGEIPHWVLGPTKVFRLAEVDWFLETFRRVHVE
jgi:hypothetical protein